VIIRKFKCHQKIYWVWFAGHDISNYGLILNTYGARDKKKNLMKKSLSANHTQWILWCHLNILIISFIFKISDFAHFFDDSQPIRSKKYFLFNVHHPLDLLHEWRFWHFHRKSLISKRRKTPFFGTIEQISDPWGKNW
jgi:hypothetical protein